MRTEKNEDAKGGDMSTRYINVLRSTGVTQQVIADVDVDCANESDVSDVLWMAVVKHLGTQIAPVPAGKYTVRLIATIVGEADGDES